MLVAIVTIVCFSGVWFKITHCNQKLQNFTPSKNQVFARDLGAVVVSRLDAEIFCSKVAVPFLWSMIYMLLWLVGYST